MHLDELEYFSNNFRNLNFDFLEAHVPFSFDEDDAVDSCNRSSTNRLVSARFKLRHYHLQIRCLKFKITVYTAATTTADSDLP